ncbi:MAG: LTA synthase family protein [Gammaproteobacteria bacterium]|nr:LTA synthase family protein [Gammaproteobacteria bacterium]
MITTTNLSSRNWLGPYRVFAIFALMVLTLLSLSRIGLLLWQWPRVEGSGDLGWMLLQGVRADLILVGLLLAVPVLLAPVLALPKLFKFWRGFALIWSLIALTLVIFIELSTPSFVAQYDIRPNRLYIEYLKYPKEVFSTLWQGFRGPLIGGTLLTFLLVWAGVRVLGAQAKQMRPFSVLKLCLTWPLVVIVVFISIRSTFDHRPANPALFAITSDSLVNSLIINSPYSVLYAAYSMRYEARSSEIYGKLDEAQMVKLVLDWPWLKNYEFKNPDYPTLHQQQATVQRDKPLNLVIVLQESLGATFVESLGGVPVTPELEKLKSEGIWFEQLYATGTRSVRGIEAVVAGYYPTPAQSTVKLANSQQNFTTVASILKSQGYQTQFVYGGEAHFDNMRGFFTGNGFSQIVDINQIKQPKFVGSWGASDEDLFNTAHQQLQQLHSSGKPFLSLIFTSSNHEPFEFPDGRIELHEQPKNTVNNAVKYADWSMGQFFQQAKASSYWQDTLFLIVADHDNRVYGSNLIPLEKFKIPGLILGADVKPERLNVLSSQVDLVPTLLSMMGVSACHPLMGRDLTLDRTSPGRALIQFDQYFALMQGKELTILKPNQEVQMASYDESQQKLHLLERPATQAERDKALAQVQMPAFLYREQKYKSDVGCGAN